MIQLKRKKGIEYTVSLAKTLSAHWYGVHEKKGKKTKFLGHFPSATTILNAYPQSAHLTKWIAEQGWNEAQAIKSAAGVRGTNVHRGIEKLLQEEILQEEAYSLEEWWHLTTFKRWHDEVQPQIISTELPVFSKKGGYAGTTDAIALIEGKVMILDWKTSGSLHTHFPLQFAAYAHAIEECFDIKIEATAAIRTGSSSKAGYQFKQFPDWREHYDVFEHVREVWQYDVFGSKTKEKEPPVLDVPSELQLQIIKG